MPYFEVQTSASVMPETRDKLCRELGRIIELVPGKSEQWLMVHVEDKASMSFAGNSADPAAAVILKSFGELKGEQYDMLTAELCKAINLILGIDPKRTYVIYEPINHWGWDGANF